MTSVPAILPFDGAVAPCSRSCGNAAGTTFSSLLGSAGESLLPVTEAAGDGEGPAAPAAQGVLAALAAMLASVTAMKGSHQPSIPEEPGKGDPSALEANSDDVAPEGAANADTAADLLGALSAAVSPAGISCTHEAVAEPRSTVQAAPAGLPVAATAPRDGSTPPLIAGPGLHNAPADSEMVRQSAATRTQP